jgi:2'-5' RNA ligase
VPIDAPGSTAIVVLTPEAEPLIGAVYRANSSAGADGMTPHVTLLVPFVPAAGLDRDVDRRLRRVFESAPPFDYVLTQLERFPRVLYLVPEPSKPFVELTNALWSSFPDHPPYEGIHDEVLPHVTVAESDDDELLARITADLGPQLPVECRAETATIVERGADLRWHPRVAFPLGG